jgi:hypothetical protein
MLVGHVWWFAQHDPSIHDNKCMDNYVFYAICLYVHAMELTLAPLCVAVSETLTKCMDNYVWSYC